MFNCSYAFLAANASLSSQFSSRETHRPMSDVHFFFLDVYFHFKFIFNNSRFESLELYILNFHLREDIAFAILKKSQRAWDDVRKKPKERSYWLRLNVKI